MIPETIKISAPGRICLYGEHQDYLGLPVITSAIDLRISVEASPRLDKRFIILCPDIGTTETIRFDQTIIYVKERDYFRSGVQILLRQGVLFPSGYDCTVHGSIPINSGTSSSSALMVAWIALLLEISGDKRAGNPYEIARLAHQAEVVEFKEPGGAMDHFAASFGGVLYIDFSVPDPVVLRSDPGKFVLGDSGEPKDTKGILSRVKGGTIAAVNKLASKDPSVTIHNLTLEKLEKMRHGLDKTETELLRANVINRGITQEARKMLESNPDPVKLGELLNAHQKELREGLRISTPKIDRMIDAALNAGALGAKINGSGGGGCMFAYAPDTFEEVAEAIEGEGGKSYIISVGEGVKEERTG